MKEKSKAKTKNGYVVPRKEFQMFAVGAMGQGMIYAMMSSYISDYYLNVLQLAPMFVLLLMLLARIWDAINDPLMGIIVAMVVYCLGSLLITNEKINPIYAMNQKLKASDK